MAYTLTVQHVDTCLSCYVLDHCNGDDELLLGVIVDSSSRYWSVKADLVAEIERDTSEKIPEEITDSQIKRVLDELFSTVHPFKTFDRSLERSTEDGESCYAWFRFHWEEEG